MRPDYVGLDGNASLQIIAPAQYLSLGAGLVAIRWMVTSALEFGGSITWGDRQALTGCLRGLQLTETRQFSNICPAARLRVPAV